MAKKEDKKKNKKESKEAYDQKVLDSVVPVISEKTYTQANELNKYYFFVPNDMNKIEVGKIIAQKYGVKVLGVNSNVKPGKMSVDWQKGKRYRKSDRKKAVVTLKEGDRIEEFFNI